MFGKNPVRKVEKGDGLTLRVQSIFHTIQGEGPFAGTPAVFIRLAGCVYACTWCDTDFESNYENLQFIDQIVSEVAGHFSYTSTKKRLVVLSGGEPMMQNILPLCSRLLVNEAYRIQIETAGPVWTPYLELCYQGGDNRLSIVVSPKTGVVHQKVFERAIAWKYIIRKGETDPIDGLPIMSTQAKGKKLRLCRPPDGAEVYVQPCDDLDPKQNTANVEECVRIAMKYGYRISLQQHKILGLE